MLLTEQVILRLILAAVLGGFIGLEREIKKRSAGLRTHILVCVGASLIMLTSAYVFDIYKDIANVDPSRIVAGVVTGIGFLGAGAIIRGGDTVHGLTTAATLWIVAAIGIAVGCGFYLAALVTTLLVLIVLWAIRGVEVHLSKHQNK
ncbi:MAG: MgtC/SapB family protein [Candidatus Omnitrophica bacterium]|nr:MgtC/SapB family protein [Candidatus Omnitrophota bacterium]